MASLSLHLYFPKPMSDWLTKNAISLLIAGVTLVSTYAVYGYKLEALQERQDRQGSAITALQSDNTQTLVALARIQTDIDYIKVQLNKIVN
jgi:hypothetical protein